MPQLQERIFNFTIIAGWNPSPYPSMPGKVLRIGDVLEAIVCPVDKADKDNKLNKTHMADVIKIPNMDGSIREYFDTEEMAAEWAEKKIGEYLITSKEI
jgi:hypothetical protein